MVYLHDLFLYINGKKGKKDSVKVRIIVLIIIVMLTEKIFLVSFKVLNINQLRLNVTHIAFEMTHVVLDLKVEMDS